MILQATQHIVKRLATMNMSPGGLVPTSRAQQHADNCKVSKTRLRYTAMTSKEFLTRDSPAWIVVLEVWR